MTRSRALDAGRRHHRRRVVLAPIALLVGAAAVALGGALELTAAADAVTATEVPRSVTVAASHLTEDTASDGPSRPAAPPAPPAAPPAPPAAPPAAPTHPLPGVSSPAGTAPRTATAAPPRPAALPVAVAIPRIGVAAPLVHLDVDAQGALEVPADPDDAGWYVGGPRPGDHGPAVIAGHVDSVAGPAVFHRLPALEPGDEVHVTGADGSEVGFEVTAVERWPKDAFPTDAVYRQAQGPELRLITCGGGFDRATLSYRDNVIVFAARVEDSPAAGSSHGRAAG
jgi:sortase (surface protein transpeptidase)